MLKLQLLAENLLTTVVGEHILPRFPSKDHLQINIAKMGRRISWEEIHQLLVE